MFCLGRFPWSGTLIVDFASLRLQTILKGLGTKELRGLIPQQNGLQAWTRLDACCLFPPAHVGNLSVIYFERAAEVWFFCLFLPHSYVEYASSRGWKTKQSGTVSIRLCAFVIFFGRTDKDANSWFLVANGRNTYQKRFWGSFLLSPNTKRSQKIRVIPNVWCHFISPYVVPWLRVHACAAYALSHGCLSPPPLPPLIFQMQVQYETLTSCVPYAPVYAMMRHNRRGGNPGLTKGKKVTTIRFIQLFIAFQGGTFFNQVLTLILFFCWSFCCWRTCAW